MLNVDVESKVSRELALRKLGVIFDEVEGNFSAFLWMLSLFEVDGLHACPALHFDENGSD